MYCIARLKRGVHLLLAACLLAPAALAGPPPPDAINDTGWLTAPEHPPVSVRLAVPGTTDTRAGTIDAVLAVNLDKGWKTYWRSPGEGGIAPAMDWSDSENLSDITWLWPAPQRYQMQGIETAGYEGLVRFPLRLKWSEPDEPVRLRATLTLPSCTTICVLTDFELALDFTPKQLRIDDDLAYRFNQAMGSVPRALPGAAVNDARWDARRELLQLTLQRDTPWQSPQVFVDAPDARLAELNYQLERLEVDNNTLRIQLSPSHWLELPELVGERIRLTVTDGAFAAEYDSTIRAGDVAVSAQRSLGWILLLALMGGLVLNVMPCVLPVLGLKLHGLVAGTTRDGKRIRRQFAASAMGIVIAFWLLAAGTLLLQWSGAAVGWGVQFQNPWFIAALATVTFVFTLNLAGVFEWRLPVGLNTWAAKQGDNSYRGHVLQGMLATLLATPCTAPFLGTAVAFALGASPGELVAVFTALGVGMALPWLLVAALPATASLLPRPGPWLHWVKPLFALMMGGTSLWLFGLLSPHTGLTVVALACATLVLLTVSLLWLRGGSRAGLLGVGAATLAVAAVLALGGISGQWQSPNQRPLSWQPLDSDAIARAVQGGETVFVDVTADWCITCQANKIGVLLREPVYSALQEDGIIRLQGDWTRPASDISAYLKDNGTYGVPFNKVYGPGAPAGIDLPVLLTDQAVLRALETARTGP
ncbi:protein-disulfide reductase DsbD family protein [Parahaliea mediterranea]|uniref:Thioredoxin family protein n=1 Tax=Parahaliea mediterranea TaxID=651086 RepID=A0A939IN30_9GAMM|nr:protein-disulfide reductase DsbD domain-containing protein [Parahaliea mediterranea]MBN7797627.1 thioredoxin family protein [Parahaliea mediterranea]